MDRIDYERALRLRLRAQDLGCSIASEVRAAILIAHLVGAEGGPHAKY